MKTITTASRKGGTGKTTTTACIGQCLAKQGRKILFVDMDEQCNLSMILDPEPTEKTVIDLLEGAPLAECVTPCPWGDVVTGSAKLATYEPDAPDMLKKALKRGARKYDFCMIDTAPAMTMTSINGIVASTGLIIPVLADTFSIAGLQALLTSIHTIEESQGTTIPVYGILLTRYQPRQGMAKQAMQAFQKIATENGTRLFTAPIRESVSIREAQALQKDIFTYQKSGNVATDYRAVTSELQEIINGK